MIELNNYDKGDVLTITLTSGEVFEVVTVVEKEYDPAIDRYDLAGAILGLEGPDVWEQVQDRLDIDTLHASQWSTRGEHSWKTPVLSGTVWVGETEETKEPDDKELGKIKSIEKVDH